ncbi:MAG: hypothetical protein M1817_005654 [Caeruleum heppii]|nr:MAG: hypothetical protein M1817_005654 [Caeruleum heppii]
MVEIKEVEDEHYSEQQTGDAGAFEDDDYTDTDSEISAASSAADLDETLVDRLIALRDVIPPKQRARLSSSVSTGYHWLTSGLSLGGKTLWIVSTSALLLGVPWALAFTEEAQMVEMEKEVKMQQSANESLVPGATSQQGQQQGARPAL